METPFWLLRLIHSFFYWKYFRFLMECSWGESSSRFILILLFAFYHVLSSTVLYCTVLYCPILYCHVMYCPIVYRTVMCCPILYCTVLYCTVLYCIMLSCTELCCAVLYYVVLYCTVLFCPVLSCLILLLHLDMPAFIIFLIYLLAYSCPSFHHRHHNIGELSVDWPEFNYEV